MNYKIKHIAEIQTTFYAHSFREAFEYLKTVFGEEIATNAAWVGKDHFNPVLVWRNDRELNWDKNDFVQGLAPSGARVVAIVRSLKFDDHPNDFHQAVKSTKQ